MLEPLSFHKTKAAPTGAALNLAKTILVTYGSASEQSAADWTSSSARAAPSAAPARAVAPHVPSSAEGPNAAAPDLPGATAHCSLLALAVRAAPAARTTERSAASALDDSALRAQ